MNELRNKNKYLSASIATLLFVSNQAAANEQAALSLNTEKTNFTSSSNNMRQSGKILSLPLRIHGFNQGGYDAYFKVVWKSAYTGEMHEQRSKTLNSGMKWEFLLPVDATDIRTQAYRFMGIPASFREIYNIPIDESSPHLRLKHSAFSLGFKLWGTTVKPKYGYINANDSTDYNPSMMDILPENCTYYNIYSTEIELANECVYPVNFHINNNDNQTNQTSSVTIAPLTTSKIPKNENINTNIYVSRADKKLRIQTADTVFFDFANSVQDFALQPHMNKYIKAGYMKQGWETVFTEDVEFTGPGKIYRGGELELSSYQSMYFVPDRPYKSAILFNDYYQTGNEIQFTSHLDLEKKDKLQLEVSSLYVGHGQSVNLFNEEGFTGTNLLTIYGPRLVSFHEEYNNWNDSARSAIYANSFLNPTVSFGYETVEGDYGYVKKASQDRDTTKHILKDANKIQIQSGYDLSIYADKDFTGKQMIIKGPSTIFMHQLGWNQGQALRISSYKLEYTADKKRSDSQISFYSGVPGQGITMKFDGKSHGEIVIGNLNDVLFDKKINSFILPSGWELNLYSDYDFKGTSKTYTGPRIVAGDEFTKTVSSLKIIKTEN